MSHQTRAQLCDVWQRLAFLSGNSTGTLRTELDRAKGDLMRILMEGE